MACQLFVLFIVINCLLAGVLGDTCNTPVGEYITKLTVTSGAVIQSVRADYSNQLSCTIGIGGGMVVSTLYLNRNDLLKIKWQTRDQVNYLYIENYTNKGFIQGGAGGGMITYGPIERSHITSFSASLDGGFPAADLYFFKN